MDENLKKKLENLPHTTGIYIYKNNSNEIIYVGKAIDIYKRVHQYFNRNIIDIKTKQLVTQIANIEYITTDSEFDAILLEASNIKKFQPKYNLITKDDKSPLYISIFKNELLPKIVLSRKNNLDNDIKLKIISFGPFPTTKFLRSIETQIRHIVPFCTQKKRDGKKCFYTHLGLCNPCPSYIAKLPENEIKNALVKKYNQNINKIIKILSGKSKTLIKEMTLEMNKLAHLEKFEEANILKNQINHLILLLGKKYNPTIYTDNFSLTSGVSKNDQTNSLKDILNPYFQNISILSRIECYDISNFVDKFAVGSMVVLTDGIGDTSNYKRFRIKNVDGQNDFAMMSEVLDRRFNHKEWNFPDLVIVDGGKGQLSAASEILNNKNINIPLIGLAKRNEEIILLSENKFKTLRLPLTHPAILVLTRIRNEAHRFAITYQRKIKNKLFI